MYSIDLTQSISPRTRHKVRGGQGVTLSVQEWGIPNGQPLLFVHAYAMSHLGWLPQVTSDLLTERFRLITFDHRGHGESDKPAIPEAYNHGELFAEDLNAIITQLKLTKPILVAWSMSGALIGDYLTKYGEDNVSGVVLVAAANKLGTPMFQTQAGDVFVRSQAQGIYAESIYDQIVAFNFINRALTTNPVNSDAREVISATSMLTPLAMRTTILMRDIDYLPLYQGMQIPILLVHAQDDRIVLPAASEELLAVRPDAKYVLYESGGHAPHWENADRFDRELAEFARRVFDDSPIRL
ncbi:MAG: alpha/beta hydrolase [Cyanosarcina radialis HA8281-LM2]|jgi:pimeloyl-ACP methyl ester carboxylesterase|nr:alpha/beta hydrolase [Cyanosarcina radialis HA8281-LM2]